MVHVHAKEIDLATELYKLALDNGLTKGRPRDSVFAVCLYLACRLNKTERAFYFLKIFLHWQIYWWILSKLFRKKISIQFRNSDEFLKLFTLDWTSTFRSWTLPCLFLFVPNFFEISLNFRKILMEFLAVYSAAKTSEWYNNNSNEINCSDESRLDRYGTTSGRSMRGRYIKNFDWCYFLRVFVRSLFFGWIFVF